jgi:hypothetical protein
MDWLEAWFPFLRGFDAGNGALEVALVILVVAIMAVAAMTLVQRTRIRASDVRQTRDAGDRLDGRDGR